MIRNRIARSALLAIVVLEVLGVGQPRLQHRRTGVQTAVARPLQRQPMSPGLSIRRVVQVGLYPAELAVDPQANRLYVVTLALLRTGATSFLYGEPLGPGTLAVVDTTTGRIVRRVPVGILPHVLLVDAPHGRVVVFARTDTTDHSAVRETMLEARTGRVLHALTLPARSSGRPNGNWLGAQVQAGVIAQRSGRIFVASDHSVGMLDATTGRPVGTVPVHVPLDTALASDEPLGRVFVTNSAASWCQGLPEPCISALDARTGTVQSTNMVTTSEVSIFALALDTRTQRLLVDLNEGRGLSSVAMLDARTLTVLRRAATGGLPVALAQADPPSGHTFVLNTGDGYDALTGGSLCTISMVETRSGALLQTATLGSSTYYLFADLAIDSNAGRAYVTTQVAGTQAVPVGAGTLHVIDTQTGAERQTLRVGKGAVAVAIDDRSGQVFVADELVGTVTILSPP